MVWQRGGRESLAGNTTTYIINQLLAIITHNEAPVIKDNLSEVSLSN